MQRKLFAVLVLTALLPALLLASGKIRGKVADAGTGEPLVGANVVVVGTSMGAATNVAGEYTILNVPAGTYTLKTSYVGYQSITISNIRVNNDLTTETNFQLPAEGVTVGTVEIIAERPMINKSATNAVRIIDNEFFSKIPARGTGAAIAIQPGVVVQGGNVYIRGSRPDEVGFKVEGVTTSSVLSGGNALYTTAEAVEQIQVQAGGFNAEYGGANAGLVQTQLRNGSPEGWKLSLLTETDRYAKYGEKSLGGYSYGYSDWTGTFGGPLVGRSVRFFGAIQNTFYRDPSTSVREPYDFVNLISDPTLTPAHPIVAASDTVSISLGGNAVGGMNNRWAYTGTLLFDLGKVQVRAAGSYSSVESRAQSGFGNFLNQDRLTLNKSYDGFGNLKLTYIISPTTFLEVNGNYYTQQFASMDPYWQEDVFMYGDSAANAALGYLYEGDGDAYADYTFYNGSFSSDQFGQPISGYNKTNIRSIGGRFDFTTQFKQHELKFGGEYTQYKFRRYNPSGVFSWAQYAQDAGGNMATLENLINLASGTGSNVIGYDVFGNEIEENVEKNGALYYLAPRKPVFAAGYIQDKIEFSDIVLNLGMRYDYIDPASLDTPDPGTLDFNGDGWILSEYYTNTEVTHAFSPRIGFSFPVSDRTQFHAQYGKFIQQSRLNDSYLGTGGLSGNIGGGFWVAAPTGWGLRPERTTQYELGFAQQVSDYASFDITAFYKEIRDQIQFMLVTPNVNNLQTYSTLANRDFSTAKGLEFKFTLRTVDRVTAQVNYTLSDARSTASTQGASNGIWQLALPPGALPRYVFPTDFDQTHRGSILLDYRFGKNDGGPVLQQLGINFLLQFNSGHPMTRLEAQQKGPNPGDARFRIPVEPINASTTPWFFQLDAKIDKTISLGKLDLNLFVYVINLLGTDNATGAFIRTADPKDDGWFSTSPGQIDAANLGPEYVAMYRTLLLGKNSGNFGPPRQIRFGLKLDY